MKIRSVSFNNKRKDFAVRTSGKAYAFPDAKSKPNPTSDDPVTLVYVDKEPGEDLTTNFSPERPGPFT